MRLISGARARDHTDPLFEQLEILKIEDLKSIHACKFMFDYFNDRLPPSFDNTWFFNVEKNVRDNMRNALDYCIESNNYVYMDDFPLYFFPSQWNLLDHDIRDLSKKEYLVKCLKNRAIASYSQQ